MGKFLEKKLLLFRKSWRRNGVAYDCHVGPITPSEYSAGQSERVTQETEAYVISNPHIPSIPPENTQIGPPIAGPEIIDRSSDPQGLSLLHTPTGEHAADIIFIHGLGGSSRGTWCKSRRLDTFWPQQWLPNEEGLERSRIFTFGYNAQFRSSDQSSVLGIADFAKDLLYDMLFSRDPEGKAFNLGEVPIIFVVHSMGGLVFKKAYLDAQLDDRYLPVMNSTKAVVFLSTPHRGSDLAPYLRRLLALSFSSTSKQYVAELSGSSLFLRNINEQFRCVANKFRIFSLYETLQSPIGMFSALILEPESATLGYPGEVTRSLNANHYNVCKFESRQDPNFGVVLGALKSLVSASCSTELEPGTRDIEKLRHFLSIPASIDHDFDHFYSRRAEGTCYWILKEAPVYDWLSSASQPEVLVLHGRPGRGKSVIAAFLTQYLREHGAAVQHFFFRGGDETKQTMAALIRSLAFQIAKILPSFRKALSAMADSGSEPKDAEWTATWKVWFVNLLFRMESAPPLYWVIDGLDEASCPQHLFDLLADLQSSKVPIRVLITGRWSQSLVSAFERTRARVPSLVIPIGDYIPDMKLYVEDQLLYNNWGDETTANVVQQILSNANGSFLWVYLIVKELEDCNSELDIERRLLELPSGMDALYQRMEEAIHRIRRTPDKSLARQLLMWAMHARRTLTADELADTLEPEFGRLLDISQVANKLCGHFIAVERDNIRLMHQTAREYLATSFTLPFSLDATVAHAEIFKASISSFMDTRLRSKLERTSPQLLEYRATSWPYHLAATESHEVRDEQLDILTRFFSQHSVLTWIYVLASLNQLAVVIDASRSVHSFIRGERKAEGVSSPLAGRPQELDVLEGWSRDLLKLVGKFGSCLTEEPASIYTSIVPFCPVSSSLYKAFGKQHTGSVTVQGPPDDWDDCLARVSVGAENTASLVCCSWRYIAVLSSANTITVWDCTTFHQVCEMEHGELVSSICFNSEGDRLASYGCQHTKIWSPLTGQLLFSIPNPPDMESLCLQFVEDDAAIIMGSNRGQYVFRCPITSPSLRIWTALEGCYRYGVCPSSVSISPDGSKVAPTYRAQPMVIWSITTAAPLAQLKRPTMSSAGREKTSFVSKVSWHPNGDEILGIFMDGCYFRWSILDGSYQEHTPAPGSWPHDVICSADGLVYALYAPSGNVRLYDYQTSTLIYHLNSEGSPNDFCFSHDGRQFYHARDSHCTIWEPDVLMRPSAADDDPAYSQAMDQGVQQTKLACDTFNDDSSDVLLMCPAPHGHIVGIATDDGAAELFDYVVSERMHIGQALAPVVMQHLAWNEDGDRICYDELGKLNVVQLKDEKGSRQARRVERFKPVFEDRLIKQLLFLPGSTNSLLVSSSSQVQRWSLEPARLEATWDYRPAPASRKWISHPRSSEHLLSVTPLGVSRHLRCNFEEVFSFLWKDGSSPHDGLAEEAPPEASVPQDGANYAIDLTSISEEIDSVFPTFMDGVVLVRVSRRTQARKLRPRFQIFYVGHPSVDDDAISPIHVPESVRQMVDMPLNVLPNGLLVFVDRSFWVCSWKLNSLYMEDDARRHFFIPRDWVPLQGLGLLKVTSTGAILCPRKGRVSVIRGTIDSAVAF